MAVELPPRIQHVMSGEADQLDKQISCLVDETLAPLSQSSRSIQQHALRLSNLAQAAEVVMNNHNHPIEAIMSYFNQDNKP